MARDRHRPRIRRRPERARRFGEPDRIGHRRHEVVPVRQEPGRGRRPGAADIPTYHRTPGGAHPAGRSDRAGERAHCAGHARRRAGRRAADRPGRAAVTRADPGQVSARSGELPEGAGDLPGRHHGLHLRDAAPPADARVAQAFLRDAGDPDQQGVGAGRPEG